MIVNNLKKFAGYVHACELGSVLRDVQPFPRHDNAAGHTSSRHNCLVLYFTPVPTSPVSVFALMALKDKLQTCVHRLAEVNTTWTSLFVQLGQQTDEHHRTGRPYWIGVIGGPVSGQEDR